MQAARSRLRSPYIVYLFDVIKRHFTAWRLGRFGHRSHDHPVNCYLEQTENMLNYFPNIFAS